MFDWLQASREVEAVAEPSEIDVRDRDCREVEEACDFGDVESTAVVGGDEREREKKVRKIVKVFLFNEQTDAMLVKNGNDGDIGVEIESGCFDIDEGALRPMLMEKPPAVLWFEAVDEELDVVCGIRFAAVDGCLVERLPEGVPCVQHWRRKRADVLP